LAQARVELAKLENQAQQGQIILLYEDETIVWRFALPRAGWWRKDQRYRLPIRPLTRQQINHRGYSVNLTEFRGINKIRLVRGYL
jgi:hypothetical protein